jgi:hypothetical protein
VCPACGRRHPDSERFCASCAIPLVQRHEAGAREPAPEGRHALERREQVRKIKPQYSEGPLVKVIGARNQAEAEFIQGLLMEEGVPSALRRSRGFDVPDFLAAGPRDVMVPASGVPTAREVLLQSELLGSDDPQARGLDPPWKVMAGLLAAVALVVLLALLFS